MSSLHGWWRGMRVVEQKETGRGAFPSTWHSSAHGSYHMTRHHRPQSMHLWSLHSKFRPWILVLHGSGLGPYWGSSQSKKDKQNVVSVAPCLYLTTAKKPDKQQRKSWRKGNTPWKVFWFDPISNMLDSKLHKNFRQQFDVRSEHTQGFVNHLNEVLCVSCESKTFGERFVVECRTFESKNGLGLRLQLKQLDEERSPDSLFVLGLSSNVFPGINDRAHGVVWPVKEDATEQDECQEKGLTIAYHAQSWPLSYSCHQGEQRLRVMSHHHDDWHPKWKWRSRGGARARGLDQPTVTLLSLTYQQPL